MATVKPHYRLKASGEIVAMDGYAQARFVSDGYANVVSALGAANEKHNANSYVGNWVANNPALLDAVYDGSTWYGKILEIPADDATREWRSWKGTADQIRAIEATEKKFSVMAKVHKAIISARHRGGSAILIGGLPGMNMTELDMERVRKDSVKYINVLSRDEITPHGYIRNPLSKYHGQPEYWVIRGQDVNEVKIHPSRVVLVSGRKAPGSAALSGDVWGNPIWAQMADSIEAADSGASIVSALLHEAVVDVVKVPNFIAGLASKDAEALHTNRWAVAKRLKSLGNVLLLDGADTWEQKQIVWNGLPEVIQTLLTVMAGAADIPVTRLIGRSASGMNATGEGDLRNHYDNIKAMQVLELGPALTALDEVLIRSTFGTIPENFWYKWNPLWQPSVKELAETDRFEANAVAIIQKTNLVPVKALEKAVQNRLVESGRYPGLEDFLKEFPDTEPLVVVDPNAPADPNAKQAEGNASGVENQRANRGNGSVNTVDMAPKPLYVRRDVLNVAEIVAWAESQGFTDIVPDLHVTIAYSKTPVDWFRMGEPWSSEMTIVAGGPRVMEGLGPDGKYAALRIKSSELEYRHEMMKDYGASWEWPDYQPHISIQVGGEVDLTKIVPYRGEIRLGPEIFEDLRV